MSINLIVSPAASGKTQYCISQVLRTLKEVPLSRLQVVVPERRQGVAFRRRLAQSGGAIGVRTGTFEDLYRQILNQAGIMIPKAPATVLHRLTQEAVEEVCESGDLIHYAGLRAYPGFILSLRDRFAELKRARVWPEVLLAESDPAVRELAQIYTVYQQKLQQLELADVEGLGWLAAEALENDPDLFSQCRLLVVDGFDSFVQTQQWVLQLLSERLPEILLTLPGSLELSRPVFHRFEQALQDLRDRENGGFPLQLKSCEQSSCLPPLLSMLADRLFEPEAVPYSLKPSAAEAVSADTTSLRLLEANSPAEESREALRWLKAHILRSQIDPLRCAVIVPDRQTYLAHLQAAAYEFGLLLHNTQGERLSNTPEAVALIDLLSLPVYNFPRRLLLDALRSPQFDWESMGLLQQDILSLELVSLHGNVIEGLAQWREVLQILSDQDDLDLQQQENIAEEEESFTLRLPQGGEAQRLCTALEAFIERLTPPAESHAVDVWVSWLEDLLDEIRFFENIGRLQQELLEGEQTATTTTMAATPAELTLLGLRSVLRDLSWSVLTGKQRLLTYAEFLQELSGAVESAACQPLPQNRRQGIAVLTMLEARGLRYEAVAVLGLAEGLFPQAERADPFFDEALRARLQMEPRLGRQQNGLFYQVITRADQYLLLTRPYMDAGGEAWEASPCWNAVCNLFDDQELQESGILQRVQPDTPRPLADSASRQELFFWAVRRGQQMPEVRLPKAVHEPFKERWDSLRQARAVLQAREADDAEGCYEGVVPDLQPHLTARFADGHIWSSSRLEAYGGCPLRFFVSVALKIDSARLPAPGYDAAQLGSLLHAVLEEVYKAAHDPADLEEVLAVLGRIAPEMIRQAPQRYGFRPTVLWENQQGELLESLRQTLVGLDACAGEWSPAAYECAFGIGKQPELVLEYEDMKVRLRGFIDRVDRDAQGNLRVVDYKTGGSHLNSKDLENGLRLQLPIYALAARDVLKLGEPTEGFYWKILKAEPSQLILSRFKHEEEQGPDAAYEVVQQHIGNYVSAIRAGRFAPQPPESGCPDYCPAAGWCWRYKSAGW